MLVVNCGAIGVLPRRLPWTNVCLCSASNMGTDQLRAQLDQLHYEANNARAKANNARLRLMRLSEAAERLRRQAAISVQTGKENEARELLFQKKKVMQALEKSKSRIELLDELSAKLNEAISVKESQLINNVSLDLEVGGEDALSPVRIVSPKEETTENSNENEYFDFRPSEVGKGQEEQFLTDNQASVLLNSEDIQQGNVNVGIWDKDDMIGSLQQISSYQSFLEHLDQQLSKIEGELVAVLRLSTLILENEGKPKNSKLQQTMDILESVRGIRLRITSIMQTKEAR
ncbi:uncharacterized protein LOC100245557 isoform X2 [Vitis vinifera]|uniref:Uncharacterized protein n=1 Tax=Vitis vinifera TaxID=29760 RepID=F6H5C0_VITVI|nr:uncharacterized protein LOC100245557 isoform X2 [Vitis vinifera]XP_010657123.1 uncharacterized protein LOC100245557 isoform X2 [Vitis vinifera]XP_010657124.1 uncharacterized protein LOC100245557 isoform X2 [Vitis vinifera]XP_010657125.1 uncharacterized protein LOC100245557 isoform X2 [Vitis vinifera]XP_010657126.1 uncharacterized protein LOC100245557 isoform X2 [Vitis vinifera]XP_019079125.1 uncharacterized protein LOC100245557 isoform X2 [Vitis vinifera]|eukprot:XP_002283630.1 PREDICTED: uncharacterized protein LOC100245557 isoform X2 [Vitis vinifera]